MGLSRRILRLRVDRRILGLGLRLSRGILGLGLDRALALWRWIRTLWWVLRLRLGLCRRLALSRGILGLRGRILRLRGWVLGLRGRILALWSRWGLPSRLHGRLRRILTLRLRRIYGLRLHRRWRHRR